MTQLFRGERLQIMMTQDELRALDDWRFARRMPTRAAAYRYPLLLVLDGQPEEGIRQLQNALVAFPGSFTKQLRDLPFQYWQLYVELLQEAKPKLNILEKQAKPQAEGSPAGETGQPAEPSREPEAQGKPETANSAGSGAE